MLRLRLVVVLGNGNGSGKIFFYRIDFLGGLYNHPWSFW